MFTHEDKAVILEQTGNYLVVKDEENKLVYQGKWVLDSTDLFNLLKNLGHKVERR